ncbi:hypothetical protein [Mesorhizobium sp. M0217]|uniref:hypothetical protein n=1 Tax=unclassified Mesorhizobium TaxID=325217 RepID=UPI00333899BC
MRVETSRPTGNDDLLGGFEDENAIAYTLSAWIVGSANRYARASPVNGVRAMLMNAAEIAGAIKEFDGAEILALRGR